MKYLNEFLIILGFTGLGEVLQRNLDKLHARYPQGFSTERSLHREAE